MTPMVSPMGGLWPALTALSSARPSAGLAAPRLSQ